MRRGLLTIGVLFSALVALGWLVLSTQASRLGRPLVDDALALEARTFELESATEPGALFDCVGAEADVSPDLSRTLPWLLPVVRDVTAGVASAASLPPELREEATRHAAWLARVVACARLRTVANAAGLGPFADVSHGRRQTMPRTMEALASLAPIHLRDALERGDVAGALDTCAAMLLITTAWLRLEGLESMLATFGPSRGVLPGCHDALGVATVEQREQFSARLADVKRLAPDYAEVMRLERTQLALRLFGAWLPLELDTKLPASARAMTRVQRASKWDRGVTGTLALRLYWKKFDAGMRDLEAAARLAPGPREAGIVAAQARLAAPVLSRFFAADPVDLKYQLYAGYLDELQANLASLSAQRDPR